MVICGQLSELMECLRSEGIPYEYDIEFGIVSVYEYFYISWDKKYIISFPHIGFSSSSTAISDVLKTINDYKDEIT